MKLAGKTLFWYHLQDKKYVEGQDEDTINDNIPAFIVETDNKKLKISGYDIGGGLDFFEELYDKITQDSHYNVFIFDMRQYLDDKTYKDKTNSLLEILSNEKCCFLKKPYAVIGTHLDKFNDSANKVKEDIITQLNNTSYKKILTEGHFYAIDMRERKKAMEIFEKLVK